MTYVAFGDSITYGIDGNFRSSETGYKMSSPYPSLVSEALNIDSVSNKGISGASLCLKSGRTNMTDIILNFNGQADIISVMLGVNDFWDALPLGNSDSPMQNNTVYGSLNLIAKCLASKYPDAFIFFMTPFECKKETNGTYSLADVANAVKEVAAKYNIFVLDMYTYGGYSAEMLTPPNDGIHPSQQHHINYTEPLISEFIVKNYAKKGNYTIGDDTDTDVEEDNGVLTPGTHIIDYKTQSLSSGYVTLNGQSIKINSSGVHKYFTLPANRIDTVTLAPGGDGPQNSLCYLIHVNDEGVATAYAPIRSGDTTVVTLGGIATGTLYFNYYADNDSVYVLQATVTVVGEG